MNAEEEKQIEILLSEETTTSRCKAALTWLSNYLEEGDILNLPPSGRTLGALKQFGKRPDRDPSLASRARKLLRQYQRR